MAEEHLEAAASGQAEGWFEQRKDPGFRKRQDASLFQTITLVMLPFIWAGFVYSLVTGNESNMNGYSLMILFFSLLNADVLARARSCRTRCSTCWRRPTACCSSPGPSPTSSTCW